MARAKRLEFLAHEVVLTFLGALLIAFGVVFASAGGLVWLTGLFTIWLGLLVFILPIIKKIEQFHF